MVRKSDHDFQDGTLTIKLRMFLISSYGKSTPEDTPIHSTNVYQGLSGKLPFTNTEPQC